MVQDNPPRLPNLFPQVVEEIFECIDPFWVKYFDAEYGDLGRKPIANLPES